MGLEEVCERVDSAGEGDGAGGGDYRWGKGSCIGNAWENHGCDGGRRRGGWGE